MFADLVIKRCPGEQAGGGIEEGAGGQILRGVGKRGAGVRIGAAETKCISGSGKPDMAALRGENGSSVDVKHVDRDGGGGNEAGAVAHTKADYMAAGLIVAGGPGEELGARIKTRANGQATIGGVAEAIAIKIARLHKERE